MSSGSEVVVVASTGLPYFFSSLVTVWPLPYLGTFLDVPSTPLPLVFVRVLTTIRPSYNFSVSVSRLQRRTDSISGSFEWLVPDLCQGMFVTVFRYHPPSRSCQLLWRLKPSREVHLLTTITSISSTKLEDNLIFHLCITQFILFYWLGSRSTIIGLKFYIQ